MTTDVRNERFEFILKVSDAAKGRWHEVLPELAPSLSDAIQLAPDHVACPVHGGTDGFRLFHDFVDTGGGVCNTCNGGKGFRGGLTLLAWLKSISTFEAATLVNNWLKSDAVSPVARKKLPPPVFTPKVDYVTAQQKIMEIWKQSIPLKGTLGETYLNSRGIWSSNQSPVLRFHPGLPYYYGTKAKGNFKFYGEFPAIITPIRNKAGKLVCLHRTFIAKDGMGKAPVPDAKKLMSPCDVLTGSAARLFSDFDKSNSVLGVAEGLETSLAVRSVARMPVWMGINATLLQAMDIPDWIETLVIWGDLDTSKRGEEAAEELADAAEMLGKKVEIYIPQFKLTSEVPTFDWLNVLVNQGLSGFPAKWRRWRPNY